MNQTRGEGRARSWCAAPLGSSPSRPRGHAGSPAARLWEAFRETDIVRAENLSKRYDGARGIEELSFTVAPGEVFGFLGPNGAGKTTTIRLMHALIRPTSGRVELFGLDSRRSSVAIRSRIGYLPGDLNLDEQLSGRFAPCRAATGRRSASCRR